MCARDVCISLDANKCKSRCGLSCPSESKSKLLNDICCCILEQCRIHYYVLHVCIQITCIAYVSGHNKGTQNIRYSKCNCIHNHNQQLHTPPQYPAIPVKSLGELQVGKMLRQTFFHRKMRHANSFLSDSFDIHLENLHFWKGFLFNLMLAPTMHLAEESIFWIDVKFH